MTSDASDSHGLLRDVLTIAFANRRVRWALAVILAAPVVFYGIEDLSIRLRFPRADPFVQVTVHRFYALHKSREKMSVINTEPVEQTCVSALFPHLGYTPCWYLARHTEQRVDFQ
jgi:hypothetical protein